MLLNLLNEGNSIVNYVQSFFSFSVSNKNIQIQDPKKWPPLKFSHLAQPTQNIAHQQFKKDKFDVWKMSHFSKCFLTQH